MKKYCLVSFLSIAYCSFLFAQEPEQDCINAIPICYDTYTQAESYTGEGLEDDIDKNKSCLKSGEKNGVWYTITVQNDGDLGFLLKTLSGADDYDWAVYNLTNAKCEDIYKKKSLEVSCNYARTVAVTGPTGGSPQNSSDENGLPVNALIPVKKGEIYVIYSKQLFRKLRRI